MLRHWQICRWICCWWRKDYLWKPLRKSAWSHQERRSDTLLFGQPLQLSDDCLCLPPKRCLWRHRRKWTVRTNALRPYFRSRRTSSSRSIAAGARAGTSHASYSNEAVSPHWVSRCIQTCEWGDEWCERGSRLLLCLRMVLGKRALRLVCCLQRTPNPRDTLHSWRDLCRPCWDEWFLNARNKAVKVEGQVI